MYMLINDKQLIILYDTKYLEKAQEDVKGQGMCNILQMAGY